MVSGSSIGWFCLWVVGVLLELRCEGLGVRFSFVFMECELVLDGVVVSVSFDDSVDMGVVGIRVGMFWFISWVEGISICFISGYRSKVNEVVFSFGEFYCVMCGEDGSVWVWVLVSMEFVI